MDYSLAFTSNSFHCEHETRLLGMYGEKPSGGTDREQEGEKQPDKSSDDPDAIDKKRQAQKARRARLERWSQTCEKMTGEELERSLVDGRDAIEEAQRYLRLAENRGDREDQAKREIQVQNRRDEQDIAREVCLEKQGLIRLSREQLLKQESSLREEIDEYRQRIENTDPKKYPMHFEKLRETRILFEERLELTRMALSRARTP